MGSRYSVFSKVERQRRGFIPAWGKRSVAPGTVSLLLQGLKARTMKKRKKTLIVRAFSPDMKKPTGSWGDAPGWYKSAPLALTDYLEPMLLEITRRVFSRCLNSKGL
jgi:hypothetical protein